MALNFKIYLSLFLLNKIAYKWILSSSHSTLNQKFYISANGSLSVRISTIIYYLRFIRRAGFFELSSSTERDSTEVQGLELHVPVISDAEYKKAYVTAISAALQWIRKQKSTWTVMNTTTIRRGVFPSSAWFFIKVNKAGADNFVLAVDEEKAGSQLVLKNLDFKQFKKQLWTFNDGLLINYGSKFVIDIQGKYYFISVCYNI
jgi:hypothetical protein